ncbi:hypothetical protein LguiA_011864 [Lonicera macranthoides]
MAYRRKQGVSRGSTYKEEIGSPSPSPRPYQQPPAPPVSDENTSSLSSSSLAAKAIRASSAYRDSSLSSAYGQSAMSSSPDSNPLRSSSTSSTKDSTSHKYTSMKSLDENKQGFWGVLARKAKAIIEDDNAGQHRESPGRTGHQISDRATRGQYNDPYQSRESSQKTDNPALQKGLGAIASSINYIGNALEEGMTIVENRTADIIQETRRLQLRKKGGLSEAQNQSSSNYNVRQHPQMQTRMQPQMETDLEIQLKASRDVAMAMAAKAKLLLRELKTVKADLAFAKERCAQLEEENRVLRESKGKGNNLEDDDLIRLQLETLLAEKARLAQENSVYARENRFLREIVEYHQLTMQDVVYLDEGSEEVTEVYPPMKVSSGSNLQSVSPNPSRTPPSSSPLTPNSWGTHGSEPLSPAITPLSSFIHIPVEDPPE